MAVNKNVTFKATREVSPFVEKAFPGLYDEMANFVPDQ